MRLPTATLAPGSAEHRDLPLSHDRVGYEGYVTEPRELTPEELDILAQAFDLAREGDLVLLEIIDRGLPVNLTNHNGDTLLILASYHDRVELMRGLLERGADTERANDRGQTALGCSVFAKSAAGVTALLDAGADPDGGGRSAREYAAYFQLDEMSALLDRHP